MQYVQNQVEFNFNYGAYSQDDDLFVAALVYVITAGVPVFVEQIPMTDFQNGVYYGTFTGVDGNAYLIITAVYTDGTYVTTDLNWAPSAECYQQIIPELTAFCFNYATYDQNPDLFVAANILDGDQIPMDHVALGVYFGAAIGDTGANYVLSKVVYTDDTYATPEPERSPGTDSIQLVAGSTGSVVNVIQQATLVGLGAAAQFEDITVSQGDTADLQLLATLGNNEVPFDLSAASLTTYIRGPIGTVVSFPNSQHTIAPDQIANRGQFLLSLSSDDTESLDLGPYREIITEVVQAGSTIYFHGFGILNVLPNVPVQ